jgi:thiosulfate/3-mercaptopyruvate sulfurtransferase
VGLVRDPSLKNPGGTCGTCHTGVMETAPYNLHSTLAGIRYSFVERGGGSMHPGNQTAFDNHCGSCHSSCGQCHISVPTRAGGGFFAGHEIKRTPPMNTGCAACHGSRVGDEYKGLNVGIPSDVHYNKGMQCTACHGAAEMHGAGAEGVTSRYQVETAPRCEDCHPDDAEFRANQSHAMHRDDEGRLELACQVCHSVQYKNCYACHTVLEEGKAVYEVNAPSHESVFAFKIGHNPMNDERHPQKWVTLRHAPAAPDNYEYYGQDLMTSFAEAPTWKLATPHNIQRKTPQAEGCMATCHKQAALFLSAEDLLDYEVEANATVVVETPPGP